MIYQNKHAWLDFDELWPGINDRHEHVDRLDPNSILSGPDSGDLDRSGPELDRCQLACRPNPCPYFRNVDWAAECDFGHVCCEFGKYRANLVRCRPSRLSCGRKDEISTEAAPLWALSVT